LLGAGGDEGDIVTFIGQRQYEWPNGHFMRVVPTTKEKQNIGSHNIRDGEQCYEQEKIKFKKILHSCYFFFYKDVCYCGSRSGNEVFGNLGNENNEVITSKFEGSNALLS